MLPSSRRAADRHLRALMLGIGIGALVGLLVAIAVAAGHLSLPFILWGAILGAGVAVLARVAGAIVRALRAPRRPH